MKVVLISGEHPSSCERIVNQKRNRWPAKLDPTKRYARRTTSYKKPVYYMNTSEIPSKLSRESFISSPVKRSPSLWLHNKSRLSKQADLVFLAFNSISHEWAQRHLPTHIYLAFPRTLDRLTVVREIRRSIIAINLNSNELSNTSCRNQSCGLCRFGWN